MATFGIRFAVLTYSAYFTYRQITFLNIISDEKLDSKLLKLPFLSNFLSFKKKPHDEWKKINTQGNNGTLSGKKYNRVINSASVSPQTWQRLLDSTWDNFCNPSPYPFACDKHLTGCDRPLAISQKSCSSGDWQHITSLERNLSGQSSIFSGIFSANSIRTMHAKLPVNVGSYSCLGKKLTKPPLLNAAVLCNNLLTRHIYHATA